MWNIQKNKYLKYKKVGSYSKIDKKKKIVPTNTNCKCSLDVDEILEK